MAIPEQQLGDLSFRGVMLLGAYVPTSIKRTAKKVGRMEK